VGNTVSSSRSFPRDVGIPRESVLVTEGPAVGDGSGSRVGKEFTDDTTGDMDAVFELGYKLESALTVGEIDRDEIEKGITDCSTAFIELGLVLGSTIENLWGAGLGKDVLMAGFALGYALW
jgi:hypothetical protein